MDIDKIPVLGKVNRSVNAVMINLILLAVIFFIMGIVIPFYPKVLAVLVGALLIVGGVIFLAIAFHLHQFKLKYTKYFKKK